MATREEIKEFVIQTCEEMSDMYGEVNEESRLNADLEFDSLDIIDFRINLEFKYNLHIPDDVSFTTVGESINYIHKHHE